MQAYDLERKEQSHREDLGNVVGMISGIIDINEISNLSNAVSIQRWE